MIFEIRTGQRINGGDNSTTGQRVLYSSREQQYIVCFQKDVSHSFMSSSDILFQIGTRVSLGPA